MSGYRSHISVLFLAVVLTGSLLSITHVHNHPLNGHEDEKQHKLVENDLFCPICATIVFLVNEEPTPQSRIFEQQEPVLIYSEIIVSDFTTSTNFGRAPPVLA